MMYRIASLLLATAATLTAAAQEPVTISYAGTTATVTIPDGISDVTASVNGANVTISSATTTTEYTYRVTGSSNDGSLTLAGAYKLTLQLDGLTLTNAHGGAAIDVECGKRISVILTDGTVNTLADAALGSQKAALYFTGHPEFEGGGTLNVTGRKKHAVCSKEYMELKSSTGIINILGAVSDGLHCGKGKVNNEHNYFLMKGGTVNILNVGSDGIDSDDYGCVRLAGGTLAVNVGDGATGVKADSTITLSGTAVTIAVTGADSEGLRSRYATTISGGRLQVSVTGNGSKAVKSKRYDSASTVLGGGYVTISGGDTRLQVLGGSLTDATTGDVQKCMGLSADADLTMTGGTLTIAALGSEAYTLRVKGTETLAGGQLDVTHVPWRTNNADCRYDMTAYVAVAIAGQRLADYSAVSVGAFADETATECVGYAVFPEGADYGIMRLYANAATAAQPLTFRLHSDATGSEYALTPATVVTFAADACVGEPSSPLLLTMAEEPASAGTAPVAGSILGDVNGDGLVNIADVACAVACLTGSAPASFRTGLADLNKNGEVDANDIAMLLRLILAP